MAEATKKAKWPISERAADIEQGKGFQKITGKVLDTRKQTGRVPEQKAVNKVNRKGN